MSTPRIGIVIGTTRETRFADKPAQWIAGLTRAHSELDAEVIDLRDYPLPFFEEATAPAYAPPPSTVARHWAAKIADMDGYIFVTGEYNRSIPGVLKNALDYAYREFNRKPAAFVAYGGVGGARAVEQLRLICAELQLASMRNAVHIGMEPYLAISNGAKTIDDYDFLKSSASAMHDELAWWARALMTARNAGKGE
ncbi:NADPH-dependent FMN reductase [Rhizobiaceae sp. 2RAB30]